MLEIPESLFFVSIINVVNILVNGCILLFLILAVFFVLPFLMTRYSPLCAYFLSMKKKSCFSSKRWLLFLWFCLFTVLWNNSCCCFPVLSLSHSIVFFLSFTLMFFKLFFVKDSILGNWPPKKTNPGGERKIEREAQARAPKARESAGGERRAQRAFCRRRKRFREADFWR